MKKSRTLRRLEDGFPSSFHFIYIYPASFPNCADPPAGLSHEVTKARSGAPVLGLRPLQPYVPLRSTPERKRGRRDLMGKSGRPIRTVVKSNRISPFFIAHPLQTWYINSRCCIIYTKNIKRK